MSIRIKFLLIVILCLVVIVYQPGLSGSFLFDDFLNIVNNPQTELRHFSPDRLLQSLFSGDAGPFSRPLSMLSFTLERHFFGLHPLSFKRTNLVIHLVNTTLVFLLTQALLFRFQARYPDSIRFHIRTPTLALLITAAWALTPINLTAVLYIVQRMESLATLFMLAGLLVYLHGRSKMEDAQERAGSIWIAGGLTLGAGLGILAKESAVMLPVYALLVEWTLFGFGANRSSTRSFLIWLYALVLLIPGIIGLALYLPDILSGNAYADRPFGLSERLWTETRVIWHYLWWIVAPSPGQLSLYHDAFPLSHGIFQPWTTFFSSLSLAGLLIVAVFLRRRLPLVSFGILWFFVPQLLVSTVLPLELAYEHRNYMATIGIFLALFSGIFSCRDKDSLHRGRVLLAVGLIALHALLTFLRAEEWGDPLHLAQLEATRQAESPRANYELGRTIMRLSPDPSSPLYTLAIESFKHAAVLPGSSLLPFQALIYTQAKYNPEVQENWWAGMRSYIQSHSLSPRDISAIYSLISAQANKSISLDPDKLEQVLQTAYQQNQQRYDITTLYADFALNVRNDYKQAEALLQAATAQAPKKPQVWINLIRFQLNRGQTNAAETGFSRLSELNRFGRLNGQIQQLRNPNFKGAAAGNNQQAVGTQ